MPSLVGKHGSPSYISWQAETGRQKEGELCAVLSKLPAPLHVLKLILIAGGTHGSVLLLPFFYFRCATPSHLATSTII